MRKYTDSSNLEFVFPSFTMAAVLAVKCQGRGCIICWSGIANGAGGRGCQKEEVACTVSLDTLGQRVCCAEVSRGKERFQAQLLFSGGHLCVTVQRVGKHVLDLIGRGLLISFYVTCTNVTPFLFFSLTKGLHTKPGREACAV